MTTMVYYYTLSGHCAKLSAKIADQLRCAAEQIVEKKKRVSKGFLRFLNGGSAVLKKTVEIEPVENEPGQFDRIVIVTPLWAASPTPAVRGFADTYRNELGGKKLGLVVTNLGTDPAEAIPKYQELFPEPLVTKSFTKARGEWDDPREDELIAQFISDMDS